MVGEGEHPRSEGLVASAIELWPLPAAAAKVVKSDRGAASASIGAALHPQWPLGDLLEILAAIGDDEPAHGVGGLLRDHFGVWVMVERESTTVVGDAGFHGPPIDGTVEIGYSVVPDRRRRGYATEAAITLVDWALGRQGVSEVIAGCDAGNAASARTLEKSGFRRTGHDGHLVRWRYAGRGS